MIDQPATGIAFTSLTCPHCPIAKQYFDEIREVRDDVELHVISVNAPNGQKMAEGFGVQSVPSFIFYGPGHKEPMGLVGAQEKGVLNKYIDIALGKNVLKKKASFSIKNFIKKK